MDQAMGEMIEGLRQAMQAERTGHEFYKMAAKTTEDPAGREVFEQLAQEEAEHFNFLAAHYRSLMAEGRLATDVQLGRGEKLDHPIFSPELRQRIGQAHFEMSALAVAVQLELNGINHYRAMARKATLPEVRRFFEDLVVWETAHYEALLQEQEALQEAYWNEAGFERF
jgi:rubrerythrin